MRHPGLTLNIPPYVFCVSWCPDFEFRGDIGYGGDPGFYADWRFEDHLITHGDGICPAPAEYTDPTGTIHDDERSGARPPQHGLQPDKMALITSDCDAMRYPSIKWA